ncbi:hypothetical protein GY45DRAFT_1373013 [Cubamyces sp. BRFM 1775]|nr:hypothetical protein GY45DRAFT_1373013 [Cubamyces sp. BRFM 1775]
MKTHDNFKPLILAHELKLEIGEGGCDPSPQAQNVYVAYYSSDEARLIRDLSCCPAIIIGSAGPNVRVSGAVFADQLVVQNLGDSISVVPLRTLCLKELDNYYTNLIRLMAVRGRRAGEVGVMPGRPARSSSTGVTRTLQPALLIGPHFQRYDDEQGKTVTLTYKRRLATEYPMKAVFVAEAKTDTETRDVVVKFTPVYGKAAHELLASASPPQAPKLHFCDAVESVGMWVVVMDYVEGKAVAGVLQDPARVASLQNAVKTLHANGFVFGDLRNPNVLEVGDGVMLIDSDFDWCGKEGTARYPSDILLEEGVWHAGVQRGGLLKYEHDWYQFRALTAG